MGIRCYDIDVVATADGELLVSHPKALQVYLSVQALQSFRPPYALCLAQESCALMHQLCNADCP